MLRLVQLHAPGQKRRVAVVEEPKLRLLDGVESVLDLARTAIDQGRRLADVIEAHRSRDDLEYDPIYQGQSEWTLLPAVGDPEDAGSCLVTGTGLTHRASAESRANDARRGRRGRRRSPTA